MERHIVPFVDPAARQPALAEFDEYQFLPKEDCFDAYSDELKEGYERIGNLRVVIAGLARDVVQVLPKTIARIERQGALFGDYRVVIYENDSQDHTLQRLYDWAARNSRVSIVTENRDDPINLPTRCLSRASRMAYYRSQCQKTIAQEYSGFDHVMLVDTDLMGGWSYDGMAHTFSRSDWDFVGANGIIFRRMGFRPNEFVQYDAWAYRNDSAFTPLTTKTVNHMLFSRGAPFEPIYSCFGGVGVYRMEPYLAGRYDGSDVEHVTFHRDLYQKGYRRIFMNPSLIAVYGRKHRTLDPYMERAIRLKEKLLGRAPTSWMFARECEPSVDTERRAA